MVTIEGISVQLTIFKSHLVGRIVRVGRVSAPRSKCGKVTFSYAFGGFTKPAIVGRRLESIVVEVWSGKPGGHSLIIRELVEIRILPTAPVFTIPVFR